MSEVIVWGVSAFGTLGLADAIGVNHPIIQFVAAIAAGLWAKARWRNLSKVTSKVPS